MSKTKTNLDEQEFLYSPHGTKYKILDKERGHVIVYPEFHFIINKERLFLFEEFLSTIDDNFEFFVRNIVAEAMDEKIRNFDATEIGDRIKGRFLKKWIPRECDNRPSTLMQQPVNEWV